MKKKKPLASYFKTITARDKSKRVVLTSNRPEWLQAAIQEVHGSDFPNDWIYAECRDACAAIDDGAITDDDSIHSYADGAVEIYTSRVYQWAADMSRTDMFANAESEAEDLGGGEKQGTEKRIQVLQYLAICTIARAMLAAHDEHNT